MKITSNSIDEDGYTQLVLLYRFSSNFSFILKALSFIKFIPQYEWKRSSHFLHAYVQKFQANLEDLLLIRICLKNFLTIQSATSFIISNKKYIK